MMAHPSFWVLSCPWAEDKKQKMPALLAKRCAMAGQLAAELEMEPEGLSSNEGKKKRT